LRPDILTYPSVLGLCAWPYSYMYIISAGPLGPSGVRRDTLQSYHPIIIL
jgi:hypothetical protein